MNPHSTLPAPPSKVLIVDDERSIRRTLAEFLRADGYDVREAEDADAALQQLNETEFDVVVSDIILPRVTGVELLRRIHAIAPHVQVVMMTGEPTVETASESLRAGAADYLFKPITKAAILRVVANAAKLKTLDDTRRRLEAENRAHREHLERLVEERTRQLLASETQARELSRFNQGILDALTAHICVLAEDGTILAVNAPWRSFAAANPPVPAHVDVGANYLAACEAAAGEETATAREVARGLRAVARGERLEFSLEYPCHSPDTQRWFVLRATRFADADGGSTRIVVAHENITGRKRAEAALAHERALLRTLVNHLPVAVYVKDTAGRITLTNPKNLFWFNAASETEILGKTDFDFFPPEQAKGFYADEQALMKSGQPLLNHEEQVTPPGGSTRWNLVSKVPLFDAAGHATGLVGIGLDITERKQAEAEMERSHELYRRAIMAANAIPYQKDYGCDTYVFMGEGILDLTGYAPSEIRASVWKEMILETTFLGEAAGLTMAEAARRSIAGQLKNWRADYHVRTRSGEIRWISDSSVPLFHADGTYRGSLGILQDITERKQAEERLRDAQALYHSLVEHLPQCVFRKDPEGRFTYVNHHFCALLDKTPDALLGKTIFDFFPREVAEKYRQEDQQVMQTRTVFEVIEERMPAGGPQKTMHVLKAPIRNATGEIVGVQGIFTDITVQRQLEVNFLRAQRLEGLGALASGIAHDLNNILAPVLMIAPFVRDSVTDADSRAMLDTVESCARRGADIIKQLLTFARGTPGARVPLPLRHLLRDVDKIIRETFPRDIRPCVEIPKGLGPVLGDATQLHQALMNLCVNARDAMPDGGTLTLAAKTVDVDEAFAAAIPDARPGAYVCVSVADTGTGIPPENLDRIFDPFFTTKEVGKGTGLGLATVLGIVRGHEGFVRVNSQMGQGTTFELYFPASADPFKAEIPSSQLAAPPRGRGELILVVDDEAGVRDGVRLTLERHGYQVVTAAQGAEALAAYTQHRAEVRAVLTDMMMPVMNGPAMIAALRALDPRLPVLGMTGLPERKGVKGFEHVELSALLAKPFTGGELLCALRAALEASAEAAPKGVT